VKIDAYPGRVFTGEVDSIGVMAESQGRWMNPNRREYTIKIALDKPEAAKRLVQKVFDRVELLTDNPELGPRVPQLLPEGRYRHVVEKPCRIFYRYDRRARRVYILAVMRGERQFNPALLTERDTSTT